MAEAALATNEIAGSEETAAPAEAAPKAWRWLVSRRADFWVACGGASLAILVAVLYMQIRGDREMDVVDLIFSDLHLGATYGAIATRRLWKRMPGDVLLVPLVIIGVCQAIALSGNGIWIHTGLLYLAVWHRGRQNFGVAKYYQRQAGGPASPLHARLFSLAIYVPMIASVLFYTSAFPVAYEEQEYYSLPFAGHSLRRVLDLGGAALALGSVIAYLAVASRSPKVHPGERWVVLTHAAAFGAAYFLGVWKVSFLLVLAVFHEVQYLYFAWAVGRKKGEDAAKTRQQQLLRFGRWLLWPIASVLFGLYLNHGRDVWVIPLGQGVLLAHYWLDGVIWTGAAMRPAPVAGAAPAGTS